MLKRTQGRLLLTLLVITGLAGTLNNTSLSLKERKNATNLLKTGKTELFKTVEGLSDARLNFKLTSDSRSIRQYIYQIASSEINSWKLLTTVMKDTPNPEKRSLIKLTDDELIEMTANPSSHFIKTGWAEEKNFSFKSVNEALESFKLQRTEHIRYMKLSTEDMRNHVVQMPFGWIDCYQLSLIIGSNCNSQISQIKKLRSDPKFPSR